MNEQRKIIRDFMVFISGKMSHCTVWKDASDQEFNNAIEGMEKLVMNRVYASTFAPAVLDNNTVLFSETRPAHLKGGSLNDDIEHDRVLSQKVHLYSWITESI